MYRWIVFLHVLGAFAFVMAHGASANVAFKLRRETSRERIAALLDLSTAYFSRMYLALLVIALTGIGLGFSGNWWGQGWIWLVLVLIFAKFFSMSGLAARSFHATPQSRGLALL